MWYWLSSWHAGNVFIMQGRKFTIILAIQVVKLSPMYGHGAHVEHMCLLNLRFKKLKVLVLLHAFCRHKKGIQSEKSVNLQAEIEGNSTLL